MSFKVQLLIDDTALPHEQVPHGVPQLWDWAKGPVIQAGNTPPVVNGKTYTKMNPWGEVYAPTNGNPQPGTLVEIRGLNLFTLESGTWNPLYTTYTPPKLTASEYNEDFSGSPTGAHIDSTSIPGSIIGQPTSGHCLHFYPGVARASIPAGLKGVIVVCWARLRAGTYDPLATAPELILSVGADYWPDADSGPAKGVGQGRFKTLKPWWRLFSFCTASSAVLLKQALPVFELDSTESV